MKVGNILYKDKTWAFILLLPNFISFLVFLLLPILASFFLSFTEWDLVSPITWVGLTNYIKLFKDEIFLKSLINTFYFTIGNVPFVVIIALLLAVLLDQKIKGVKLFRAIFFLPTLVSLIVVGIVWRWIFNPEFGLLNYFLDLIGIEGPAWLSSSRWAMPSVIITAVWRGIGFNMVIYLAGLQGISRSHYEAADVDGANWFSKFIHVTIPLLSNTTLFVVVTSVINSFQVFDLIYVMTAGGPARATSVIVFYLYQNAFRYFSMGYASAIAYVLFFIVLIFTLTQLWLQRKRVIY